MTTIKKQNKMEIELKFPLLNPDQTIARLNSIADHISKDQYQIDVYFSPEKNDFLRHIPVSEWLRIRQSKGKVSINYKNWHNKDGSTAVSCDEFETTVGDIQTFKNILSALHFHEIVSVEKRRNIWRVEKAEIAVDIVSGLGDFIEIEAKGEFDSLESAKEYLYKILNKLDVEVGIQDYEGYPYKLLKKSGLLPNK
jgi:adenylate cyclase, class 2